MTTPTVCPACGDACGCCGGDLPPRDAWEARRNDPAAADRLAARAAAETPR